MPREVRIPWALSWAAVLLFVADMLLTVFWPTTPGRRSGVFFVCLGAVVALAGLLAAGGSFAVSVARVVRSDPATFVEPYLDLLVRSFWRGVTVALFMFMAFVASD
jgi:hypothetical protein